MASNAAAVTDITVIILTYNEAPNLSQALGSVRDWAREIFVLDSFSTDDTVEIARQAGCLVVQHDFVDYAKQRNFALEQLPIASEWILFLDADEWLPEELKGEIAQVIAGNSAENGFFINRRFVWMGKWIRRGYYPSWILRLFRHGKARCEDRVINEHLIVEGKTGHLQSAFIHEDRKGITDWIDKHNRYASHEALEMFKNPADEQQIDIRFWGGTQAQRKRWLRYRIWNNLPPLVRPFFYFFYRYVLLGGFLDGWQGFTFHFLHGLWYQLLTDIKFLEMKQTNKKQQGRTI